MPRTTASSCQRVPDRVRSRRERRRRLLVILVIIAMVLPLLISALPALGATPTAASDPASGDRGPAVRRLQLLLTAAGISVEITSMFDQQTEVAVRAAQELLGFNPDGVVRPELLEALSPVTGCTVAIVASGDPAEAPELRRAVTDSSGCATIVELARDRSLRRSWRCRGGDLTAGLLSAFRMARPGARVCTAPAVDVLRDWSEAGLRFDAVVVDVAPRAATDLEALPGAWDEVAAFAAAPAVVFAASGEPGTDQLLKDWCAAEPRCILAPASGASRDRRLAVAVAAALVALPRQ